MATPRRRVLRALGAGATAGLAGCAGDGLVAPPGASEPSPDWTDPARTATLLPDDPDNGAEFGDAVALSRDGTTALVGAPYTASWDERPGAVYAFSRTESGWTRGAKLAVDGNREDFFGYEVALSDDGTTAVVTAPGEDHSNVERAGAAYAFSRSADGWRRTARLVAADPYGHDAFGWSLALSGDGDTALVGAPHDDNVNGPRAGTTYVFERVGGGWRRRDPLLPDDGAPRDRFGSSVALSGDGTTAVVGATRDEKPDGPAGGAAYALARTTDGWRRRTKLRPDGVDEDDGFGAAAALSSDGTNAIVVASPVAGLSPERGDAAYALSRPGGAWRRQTELVADDAAGDPWVYAVALADDGTTALVAAAGLETAGGEESSATAVFSRSADGWRRRVELASGAGVALSGDGTTGLVGVPDYEGDGGAPGAGFVYEA